MDVLTQLKEATDALKEAHQWLHEKAQDLTRDKARLAAAEADHTLAGLDGKNADERKARLAELTKSERFNLEDGEAHHRAAQVALTLAELDYRYAREAAALHRAELLAKAPQEALA